MTIVHYYAMIDRLDATRQIAFLRELSEAGAMGSYRDGWELHLTGYGGSLALTAGDAIAFVAQLNKYDGVGRRICTDLPSLSAERDAPHGAFIDPPMREVTVLPPLSYRFEAPREIVRQERRVRVFHRPVAASLARADGSVLVPAPRELAIELAALAGYRGLREAGWEAVYMAVAVALSQRVFHVRVTFMRPMRPHASG